MQRGARFITSDGWLDRREGGLEVVCGGICTAHDNVTRPLVQTGCSRPDQAGRQSRTVLAFCLGLRLGCRAVLPPVPRLSAPPSPIYAYKKTWENLAHAWPKTIAMFGLVLLLHAVVASAFCTEVALWVPWNGDTVDKVANALHLNNYETLVELNADFNVDSIERGKTYTVPYTKVDPPATWATVDGCTPLLLLSADATSTLTSTSTSTSTRASLKSGKGEETSIRSTLETRARSTGKKSDVTDTRSSPSTFTGKAEETVSTRASSVTSLESRNTATSDTRTAPSTATTSETSETSLPPSSQTETPSTTISWSSLNALTSTETEASSPPQSSQTKAPQKASSVDDDPPASHGDSSYTPQATTEAEATTKQVTRTATRVVATTVTLSGIETVTQTTTETATKTATTTATATATKTITQGSSAASSSGSSMPSIVCHPDGSQRPGRSHHTDEKTLDKNAKKFCKEVKDVVLSNNFESVQKVYGKSKELYIFTISWVRGCDAKEQSVGTEDAGYKRMMGNWNGCNNKGQGGSTRDRCIEWAYRPDAIVGAHDD